MLEIPKFLKNYSKTILVSIQFKNYTYFQNDSQILNIKYIFIINSMQNILTVNYENF